MMLRIIILVIVSYFIATSLDLYESIHFYVIEHENYQLDEIIIVVSFLSFWLIVEMGLILKVLQKQSKAHEKSSGIDALTQVLNRRGFFIEATDKFIKLSKSKKPMYILYIDLIAFKSINDTYGHLIGDKVLRSITSYLKSFLNEGDIIARIGGDEFVILGASPNNDIPNHYINHLKETVKIELNDGDLIEAALSFGEAFYPKDGNTLEDLLNHADSRMYIMKNKLNKKN